MPQKPPIDTSSSLVLDVNARAPNPDLEDIAVVARSNNPFRVLILGDFSGRDNRSLQGSLAERHPLRVDRDNIDEVLRKMKIHLALRLESGQTTVALRFENLLILTRTRFSSAASCFRPLLARRARTRSSRLLARRACRRNQMFRASLPEVCWTISSNRQKRGRLRVPGRRMSCSP